MGMQRVTYFAGGLPGMLLSIGSAIAFFYGGSRVIDGTLTLGTFGAFLAYQMRVFAPAQALDGPVCEPGHGARVVAARAARFSTRRRCRRVAGRDGAADRRAASIASSR